MITKIITEKQKTYLHSDKNLEKLKEISLSNIYKNSLLLNQKEEVINLYNKGATALELSIKYNVCDATIYNNLHKWGVTMRSSLIKKGHTLNLGKKMPPRSEEHKRKISLANIGKKHSEFTKQQWSIKRSGEGNPRYGKHWSEEQKQQMSIKNKQKWQNKEWVDWRIKQYKKTPNKTEKILIPFLQEYGFEFVGDGKFWVGYPPMNPDFINKDKKTIIEFFGKFFHKDSDEAKRTNHYKQYGWNTYIIWSNKLNINPTRHIKLSNPDKNKILRMCCL